MKNNDSFSARRVPTPDQIADAPELAVLYALDEILEIALRTLVAAHPELDDSDAPFWVRETSRASHEANNIVAIAHRLRQRIRAYRTAIARVRDQRLEADPEIPF